MRVYIPFDDGSIVSFDGDKFTLHRKPNDIEAVDKRDTNELCKAEIAWKNRWHEIVKALEGAWKRQKDLNKSKSRKGIYAKI